MDLSNLMLVLIFFMILIYFANNNSEVIVQKYYVPQYIPKYNRYKPYNHGDNYRPHNRIHRVTPISGGIKATPF